MERQMVGNKSIYSIPTTDMRLQYHVKLCIITTYQFLTIKLLVIHRWTFQLF